MKKYLFSTMVLLFCLFCSSCEQTVAFSTDNRSAAVLSRTVPAGYYSGTEGKSGNELRAALHTIIKNHTVLSYTEVWQALKDIDEDPSNSNNVILIYSRESRAKSRSGGGQTDWNREHTWPKSHGFPSKGNPAYTDIHHLRPCDVYVNSLRGTKDFDNGGNSSPEKAPQVRYDSDSWEVPDSVKGDIARGIFYMAVRYEGAGETDLELTENTSESNPDTPLIGRLSTLLKWHKQDPPDEGEMKRNNKIYTSWQGNRNPFIDNPHWVEAIWGGTTLPGQWNKKSHIIMSDNYPSNYSNYTEKSYTISMPGASAIRLHFEDFFIENYYDTLKIYDENNREIEVHTGNKGSFMTSDVPGSSLTIHFSSDYSVTEKGWKTDYFEYK